MARKTDEERLQDVEQKLKQMEEKKKRLEQIVKEKKRKEDTRRKIQIGAIFMKYFDVQSVQEAEKLAWAYKDSVKNNRDKWIKLDVEKEKNAAKGESE